MANKNLFFSPFFHPFLEKEKDRKYIKRVFCFEKKLFQTRDDDYFLEYLIFVTMNISIAIYIGVKKVEIILRSEKEILRYFFVYFYVLAFQ